MPAIRPPALTPKNSSVKCDWVSLLRPTHYTVFKPLFVISEGGFVIRTWCWRINYVLTSCCVVVVLLVDGQRSYKDMMLKNWLCSNQLLCCRQMQTRYTHTTEVRNNLIAALQNVQSTQRYLNTIEFPYCKPAEMETLQRAANNIYTGNSKPWLYCVV